MRMQLYSLKEFCKAAGGAESIWRDLEALARLPDSLGDFRIASTPNDSLLIFLLFFREYGHNWK
jgi:hypothetical protein